MNRTELPNHSVENGTIHDENGDPVPDTPTVIPFSDHASSAEVLIRALKAALNEAGHDATISNESEHVRVQFGETDYFVISPVRLLDTARSLTGKQVYEIDGFLVEQVTPRGASWEEQRVGTYHTPQDAAVELVTWLFQQRVEDAVNREFMPTSMYARAPMGIT